MNPFEKWRREVNIILNDTVGYSLRNVDDTVAGEVRCLYENGEDPVVAAQYVAGETDPSIDIEQILIEKITPKLKQTSKRTKKFKVDNVY